MQLEVSKFIDEIFGLVFIITINLDMGVIKKILEDQSIECWTFFKTQEDKLERTKPLC